MRIQVSDAQNKISYSLPQAAIVSTHVDMCTLEERGGGSWREVYNIVLHTLSIKDYEFFFQIVQMVMYIGSCTRNAKTSLHV